MTAEADAAFNWHIVVALLQICSPLFAIGIFIWNQNNPNKINIQQPLSVALQEEFTSKEAFDEHTELNRLHHDRIEARISSLEKQREHDKDAIIAAGEARSIAIHNRINVAIEQIGELRGEIKHLSHAK